MKFSIYVYYFLSEDEKKFDYIKNQHPVNVVGILYIFVSFSQLLEKRLRNSKSYITEASTKQHFELSFHLTRNLPFFGNRSNILGRYRVDACSIKKKIK